MRTNFFIPSHLIYHQVPYLINTTRDMRLLLLALSIGRASTESPFDAFHHAFPKPHGKPGIFIKGDTVFVHSNNDQPCKPDHRVGNWSVTGG